MLLSPKDQDGLWGKVLRAEGGKIANQVIRELSPTDPALGEIWAKYPDATDCVPAVRQWLDEKLKE